MKALYLLLITLLLTAGTYAQKNTPPDYAAIQKEVTNPQSAYYYPRLLARYQANDSTLNKLQYRHLYYGHLFSTGYNSKPVSGYSQTIHTILLKDSLTRPDLLTLIETENKVLLEFPFHMRDLTILAKAYVKAGNMQEAARARRKIVNLVATIMYTGDGQTEETAFHVISVAHEYDLLSAIGLSFGGKQSLTPKQCDYLSLAPNNLKLEGIYFNVSQILLAKVREVKK